MSEESVTIDRVKRAMYLVSVGVHSSVIDAAIARSTDEHDFGQLLGFIEDLLDMGCVIEGPHE